MPIVSQYIGSTRASLGASFLDTRAILHIEEGYNTGATTEYVSVGSYEVDSYRGGDVFTSTINLEASNRLGKPKRYQANTNRVIPSLNRYYDNFFHDSVFEQNFTMSGGDIGISGLGAYFTFRGTSEVKYLQLNAAEPIADFRLKFRFKKDASATSDAQQFEVDFRKINEDNHYRFIFASGGGPYYILKYINGVATIVGSATGASIGSNSPLEGLLVARGGYMYFASENPSGNYDVKVSGTDQAFHSGSFSIGARAQGNASWALEEFDLVEIGDKLITGTAIQGSLGIGGIGNINLQNDIEGFGSFSASTGTSIVTGLTNGFYQADLQNTTTGSSWHIYIAPVSTPYTNVAFECQVRGSSNSYVGLVVGSTLDFYSNPYYLGATFTNLLEGAVSGIRSVKNNLSNYLDIRSDVWYDMKLIKVDNHTEWFVNGTLAGSVTGSSFDNIVMNPLGVGFVVWRGAIAGTKTSFRNPRMYRLNETVESVSIDANTPLSSAYSRLLNDSVVSVDSGSTTNILEYGSSRGILEISSNIVSTDTDNSNNGGANTVILNSDRATSYRSSSNTVKLYQRDNESTSYINEPNIASSTTAQSVADRAISLLDREVQQTVIRIPHFPTLEKYDQLNLVDTNNGVSHFFIVDSVSKSYSPNSGYRQTLILSKK